MSNIKVKRDKLLDTIRQLPEQTALAMTHVQLLIIGAEYFKSWDIQ
ncbi:hypothetical protein M901_0007 [Bacteriovorax sp. DB6_IX]|nr:hypothetical protein M901_0007 [Bacteriovorax sp. DB6_IX]